MASCKECLCFDVCSIAEVMGEDYCCPDCKDRNRFVELPCKIGDKGRRIMKYQNTVVTISNYGTNALKETLYRYGELGFGLVNVVMAKNQYNVDVMYLFFTKTKEDYNNG